MGEMMLKISLDIVEGARAFRDTGVAEVKYGLDAEVMRPTLKSQRRLVLQHFNGDAVNHELAQLPGSLGRYVFKYPAERRVVMQCMTQLNQLHRALALHDLYASMSW